MAMGVLAACGYGKFISQMVVMSICICDELY
jgi:hypothetical protein